MLVNVVDHEPVEAPEGSTALDLAKQLRLTGPAQAVAVTINGQNVDLTSQVKDGDELRFWDFNEDLGREVFWHTSAHVLAQAILRLYPDAKPTIGPPIENGFYYDFANLSISEEDFPRIEKEVKAIVKANFRSEREEFASREEAIKAFSDNKYKVEIIEGVEEEAGLSAYRQGEFYDLCRGPHLPSMGKIKAFKVLKTSGAYWRGDSKNEMLTRVYAISFPDREMLKDHLKRLEEARKRDHKVLGPRLNLFSLHDVGPGLPFIHPNGVFVWNKMLELMREFHDESGYVEIKTPAMLTKELWVQSGHWENYREHMYTSEVEDRHFAIKPMNCPGCMVYYKTQLHSYRDLPLRVAEFGHVHRYEPSGAISGLFRVRGFHQDDAHIFMTPDQIEDEILGTLRLLDSIYSVYGLDYHLELSTRPEENTIGSDDDWEHSTDALKRALERWGRDFVINEGDGAFYGPKIDIHIRDAIGRTWQCGTIQLDMSLPERFDLEYTAPDGVRRRPIMIHRAIYGSIERFFGILIEHFAGKFPLWMSPRQVRILTVAERHEDFAHELAAQLRAAGLRVEVDDDNESVGKKVRNAQLDQVNYMLTIGDREQENRSASLRTRDNVVHGEIDVNAFLAKLSEEIATRSLASPYSKPQEAGD